ncbi:hypothetical protein DES53_101883 [Roseimicrobium gellanilyticum]|uniref:Uncharacterized protein n=1 Tax=Roseimicrobium gellanilyticum TaxID=748857 RepID=A0A366HUW6_9BACT|nr:PTPDL family protein [Roseimicrobium gellanilyticum]RBP48083.1 hypothetical protein DES53_101883 [Roseimicrobium gellanilyticum]
MKLKFKFTPLFASLLLAVGIAHADSVTLKTGEKFEGKILSDTDTEVVLEYNLTPKIKDKKTIKKSDIQDMVKLSPSELAFVEEKMSEVLPTQDLMTGGDYERIIQDKLRTFVAKYPGTKEAGEVEKMISTLSEEKGKVVAGEVKMEGKWLDPATAKREAYNIEAYRTRVAMKAATAGTDEKRFREALRHFDTLRTQYGASAQYVDSIPEALEILAGYQKQLAAMAAEYPVIQKQRDDGMKTLTGGDLQLTRNSIEQEARAFKTVLDAQIKQKVKWRDVYKFDLKSIQSAQDTAMKEAAGLKALDLIALRKENETLGSALRYVADEKPAEADAELDKLRAARATLINRTEMARVEKEVRALKDRMRTQQKGAGAMPVAAATGADEEAPSANPIEEAMKQREKEKQEKASGKSSSKSSKKESDDKDAADDKKDEKKTTKAKTSSSEKSSSTSTPEPEPGLLAQLNDYIPFIGGGLLLILILAMVFGKKKKADA